ncbi:TPA: HNH endonuclease [Streptococcus suis]|nr:HNH endonuclease [Streptococcus suis]
MDKSGLPNVCDIFDTIVTDAMSLEWKTQILENRNSWITYLKRLDEEYRQKSNQLHLIQTYDDMLPVCANESNLNALYGTLREKCFAQFPTISNVYNNAICPICEGTFTTKVTLEHIIPKGSKGRYQFAILPINLVKCCAECNTSKHQEHSKSARDREVNPYFEEEFKGKVDIENYLILRFMYNSEMETWEMKLVPPSEDENDSDDVAMVKNFINIYNIIQTYQNRVNIEYNRMISVLSKQLILPLSKNVLVEYIKKMRNDYSEKYTLEEGWIDQNYFGKLICETLTDAFEKNPMYIDRFYDVIKQRQLNINSLVFEKNNFLDQLKLGQNRSSLEDYLEWIEKLMHEYYNDFILYFNHLKRNFVNYKLQKPNNEVVSDKMYETILSIFDLYFSETRSFDGFKEKCLSILV